MNIKHINLVPCIVDSDDHRRRWCPFDSRGRSKPSSPSCQRVI